VVGADGLLGAQLVSALRSSGHEVVGTSRRAGADLPLDLATVESSWAPPRGCRVAYLCAGITSLAVCRDEPARSRRVNVEGLGYVAQALLSKGVFVVLPSTSLVFDGSRAFRRADEPPDPLTEYGRQKADAERLILQSPHAAVVRMTKVVGPGTALLTTWRRALEQGDAVRPFADKVLSPVSLASVVDALRQVGDVRLDGITQLSGDRDITYADAAARIAERVGAPASLVHPASCLESAADPGLEPRHTTLDSSRARHALALAAESVWQVVDAGAGL